MAIESELGPPREEKMEGIFGYNTLVLVGDEIIEIKGPGKSIKLGEIRALVDDGNGYVGGIGLKKGDRALILGFVRPYTDGETDHIVNVRVGDDEDKEAWLKPTRII